MNDIHDRGITSSMQYDRWIKSINAKAARKSPAARVIGHPVTFVICVWVLALIVVMAVLNAIGALAQFLGN